MHPHAVSAFHQTTMSMAGILTGQTPSLEGKVVRRPLRFNSRTWCGMSRFDRGGRGQCIPDELTTVAETLREHGYWTAAIQSNPLLFDPLGYSQGFDRWQEVGIPSAARASVGIAKSRAAGPVNRAAIDLLDDVPSERFFLYVHYMDVHDYGYFKTSYRDTVETVDAAIGELLDAFRERDWFEDTVFIVTADHGERLGEKHAIQGKVTHNGTPSFETLLRVPLIIHPRPDVAIDPVFRGQDTRYLIEEIAGVESPRPTELRPEETYLSEFEFRTYRNYPYKAMWRRSDGAFFLFDLERDRREKRNVAKQRPQFANRFKKRMRVLARELGTKKDVEESLSEADKGRLRALGYLD